MKRRAFLQASGAAILASQLPNIADKGDRRPETSALALLPPGEYVSHVNLPVRRRVIFLSCHDEGYLLRKERWPLPTLDTVVLSDDGLYAFTVIDQACILPSIAYVTSTWDVRERGLPAGKTYEGVVMTVGAVAPGSDYADCNIRRVATPQGKYTYSVCEAWRSEALGDWQAQSYAVDALYPEDMKQKSGFA